ncbi:MAG: nicotinate-nucleotide--dimethylbenzimidazole phosphoribosyltransferase [Dethiobacter sp.]|jgi:nicotinate-nucleotide--dimethylbenzimidazole phosphoribosyltransferase|nr:nicotinate-nucleotide--dimethylbenzimidazole phosphoribosyltransferase [Dethiobacter sp.]
MKKLQETLSRIGALDEAAIDSAQAHLDNLTKPPGSLGVLEEIVKKIAGITGEPKPHLPKKTCILMAGDHGVVEDGVSAYPQEVTPQMVLNFLRGGAAMNVLARHAGAELVVVDIGVAADLPDHPLLKSSKIAYGTANFTKGPAMSREQAVSALEAGIAITEECLAAGSGLLGTGEMGIGNTTPSTAIIAAYKGGDVGAVCGRGTGIDNDRMKLKIKAVQTALSVNNPDLNDPLDVLSKVGGFEIAGMAGVMLASAAARKPVLIDGFISGAAAVIAAKLCPQAREYMLASHLSEEPGHRVILELLGLRPFLHMNLRLGEGTGSALAMTMIDAALKIVHEMATFGEAGVSTKE